MTEKVNETLARLLATENLRVEHKRVQTAYMDLQNRVLVLPIFKEEMPKDVYDLLVGHEVGHALETPIEGWHNSLQKDFTSKLPNKGAGFKTFLNVVEDARIERKMKMRYPGLRKSFFAGYSSLFKQKFFGDFTSEDIKSLLLIDRINLYYKVGAFSMVSFKEEEKKFIRMVDACETFDDVIKASVAIYDYCKEELRQQKEEQGGDQKENNDSGDSEESDDFGDGFDVFGDLDFDEGFDESEETIKKAKSGDGSTTNGDSDSELESKTDKAFREKEKELFNHGMFSDVIYANIPLIDPNDFIISNKVVNKNFNVIMGKGSDYIVTKNNVPLYKENYEQLMSRDLVAEFNNRNSKYIGYLVKEFELRKNAAQLAKERQHKTGKIDINKIWSYKFNDEVFKNLMIVPNGKNHGMIMILDWSGSMDKILPQTIEQVLVLTAFCKKVGIPFRVYAFLSHRAYPSVNGINVTNATTIAEGIRINTAQMSLAEFLTSESSGRDYREMCKKLLTFAEGVKEEPVIIGNNGYVQSGKVTCVAIAGGFGLGGTPLNESILITRFIVEKFKKENKLDVVTSILLSDGQGDYVSGVNHSQHNSSNVVYVDPITKMQFKQKMDRAPHANGRLAQMNVFVRMVRETTNTNFIGFFIFKDKSSCNAFCPLKTDYINAVEGLKKQKFHTVTNLAFNEFYFIDGDDFAVKREELVVSGSETKSKLRKAFMMNQNKKLLNRVLLNRFIKVIAQL